MTNEPSDSTLVEMWSAGDARAGEQLFERYYDSVARFFFNKADEASVQDLIQRTFLACVEGLARLRGAGNFRSYLFGAAYRLLCKHYERRARERGTVDIAEISVADFAARTPSQVFIEREEQRLLLLALRAIPLEHQALLELFYWEKLPIADIAHALQIPLSTAKTRLRRSRQLLEEALAARVDSPVLLRSSLDNLERWAADVAGYHLPHPGAAR